MKLSNTQEKLLNELKNVVNVLRKYKTFEEFYDNSKWGEQKCFNCGDGCNSAYKTSNQIKQLYTTDEYNEKVKNFEDCRNNGILITFAKTETLKVLERYGLIKIIKTAEYKGGAEKIQVLSI